VTSRNTSTSSTDVLLNPKVIVETLSESTEGFDRGTKFTRYEEYNPTLTDYILVSQDSSADRALSSRKERYVDVSTTRRAKSKS